MNITMSIEQNINSLKEVFKGDEMVAFRELKAAGLNNLRCCLVYVDGMANKEIINRDIINPILSNSINFSSTEENILDIFEKQIINSCGLQKTKNFESITKSIIYGDTALFIDGAPSAIILSTIGWERRSIQEPESETVVKGPREGFTESLNVNISLIRKRIKSPGLKFIFKEIGTRTRTKICICYIQGIADVKILNEVVKRVDSINIDGIVDSKYIQESIKDNRYSIFTTIGDTERPDIVAAKLLEGRFALICDGSPSVLTVPFVFIEYFQTNEDYYNDYAFQSYNRLTRLFGFFLSTSVPAIYVALVTFHQELIPTSLILSIYSARQTIPFPSVVEAFLMLIAFGIFTEAGIRTPKAIGQALGIVGTLILGDAAVNARFVSAPIVIVVALTGISALMIPKALGPSLILRYVFLLFAAFLGLYGYFLSVEFLFLYLCSIKSFGVPYMLSTTSYNPQDIKDTAIRVPFENMKLRPKLIAKDRVRQSSGKPNGGK
jgi:spore germination protein KA